MEFSKIRSREGCFENEEGQVINTYKTNKLITDSEFDRVKETLGGKGEGKSFYINQFDSISNAVDKVVVRSDSDSNCNRIAGIIQNIINDGGRLYWFISCKRRLAESKRSE